MRTEKEKMLSGELYDPLDLSVYGSVKLTKDKVGLEHSRALKEVVDAVVTALEKEKSLPDKVQTKPTEKVKNPFG